MPENEEETTTCADCGAECSPDGQSNCDGGAVCDSCAEDYFWCETCERTRHNDDEVDDSPTYCADCCEESTGLAEYHSQKRRWSPGTALVMGVELELKAKTDRLDVRDLAKSLGFIAEQDGSLCDTYGIEVVGMPMGYHENMAAWGGFISKARRIAKGWDAGKGYGMHVSINRRAMSAMHQGKLLVFVNHNRALCERVAGRKQNEWARYARKRVTDGLRSCGDKYEALSLRSYDRMEMRIFRSTLSAEGFARNLQFALACVEYTRTAPVDALRERPFIEWLSRPENSKQYRALRLHLGATSHNSGKEKTKCA